jgi:hypothetical protein
MYKRNHEGRPQLSALRTDCAAVAHHRVALVATPAAQTDIQVASGWALPPLRSSSELYLTSPQTAPRHHNEVRFVYPVRGSISCLL